MKERIEKMKKAVALILALCSVILCACGSSTPKTDSAGFASQDAFLKDMAAGITQRLDNDEDSSKMTAEEKSVLYLKLVGFELDKIEKYQDSVFEDEDFNELAHIYIEACQVQRYAAQNYKNSALHDSLWNGGRTTRAAVITELYSRYGLPITSEQAASYAPSSYTISVSSSSSKNDVDYTDSVSVKALPSWNEHYANADYYHYDLAVTNKKADCSLHLELSAVFYDSKGNVIGSDKGSIDALGKGETQYCKLRTDTPFSRAEYKIESAKEGYTVSAVGDMSFKVTTPNNKVMVAATCNKECKINFGSVYCVFYNGQSIVDVDLDIFNSSSVSMKKGETLYAELSTNKAYTSYELYYHFTLD